MDHSKLELNISRFNHAPPLRTACLFRTLLRCEVDRSDLLLGEEGSTT